MRRRPCVIWWEKVARRAGRTRPSRVQRAGGTKWVVGPGWADAAEKRWESADKPGSVEDNHSSGTHVTVRLERPTRKPLRAAGTSPKARALPYLVLLQVGFAVPPNVATGAVRSYRTLSPLPATTHLHAQRHRRFAFCCTFRGLAPPRRYLAPCPMEPGLSSTSLNAAVAWPTPAAQYTAGAPLRPRFVTAARCRARPALATRSAPWSSASAAPARAPARTAPCDCAP